MESEGRSRIGRTGSRRSHRNEWSSQGRQYSSSDEEPELKMINRNRLQKGDDADGGEINLEHKNKQEKPLKRKQMDPPLNQLSGVHQYQEIPQMIDDRNRLDDFVVATAVKSNNRKPHYRRRMRTGSSISSSDNNSDTTYAESDVNSSLRTRMLSLENEIAGTPPDPAPPEIPPRGPSHHHPLLASAQRRGPSSPQYQDAHEDEYQQPATNLFLSQEYLMSGNNPRCLTSGRTNSPGDPAYYGPSPTHDYLAVNNSQPRLIEALGSQKAIVASVGVNSLGTLPAVRNNLNSRGSFSGRGLHLGKTWKERCSWRCAAIILIFLSAILAALLAYFAAVASLQRGSKGCIVVEDAAKVIAAGMGHESTSPFVTTHHPTSFHSAVTPSIPISKNREPAQEPPNKLSRVQKFNTKYSDTIPPKSFWNAQFEIKQPSFVRFNLTVPRSSHLAFYGRRNVAPSITQYDFAQFLTGGKGGRNKRSVPSNQVMTSTDASRRSNFDIPPHDQPWAPYKSNHYWSQDSSDYFDNFKESESDGGVVRYDEYGQEEPLALPSVEREKRFVRERDINVTLVEFLDTGIWYLSLYNDALISNKVSLLLEEAPELQSACPNDCSGRGTCVTGSCECQPGWTGHDCTKSVCPVLCSNHGRYGGGLCHCDPGWKGHECEVPQKDCIKPDCSGHGTCAGGQCQCHPGWKGENCEEVDCLDPTCSSHGWCVDGQCICRAGWTNDNCSEIDSKVFTCLPDCSGHGRYDLHTSSCICDPFWGGQDCSEERCSLECVHGKCIKGGCECDPSWTGTHCNEKACDNRCVLHGQCHNGTCVCVQGWNGRHCTLPGCPNSCSGHGVCMVSDGEFHCECSTGWMGLDCSVQLELQCDDKHDNDGDGLEDCSDSECCSTKACESHVLCMVSSDPEEVLLRKQPPAVTASFYQRVKFIIEDVQIFARKDEFSERRVSVIRGRVVTSLGQGIVGVRTSVDKEDNRFGLTATRKGGWFDLLVNGGGAVNLKFQGSQFEPLIVTVPVLWNQIVHLDPVVMTVEGKPKTESKKGIEDMWAEPCLENHHDTMQVQVVSTYMPQTIGGAPEQSLIFTESQIILEGSVFEKVFEADPNITYPFTWNKRNVYKQKVYGEVTAKVFIGYKYSTCAEIVWETQTAQMYGFLMDISDVGGWNIDMHHMYNFESGLLQRGDGSILDFKSTPPIVTTLIGTGWQRQLVCTHCSGTAKDAALLAPSTLVSGPDGSIYVGDFNLIRRVTPEGMVFTVLQLSASQVSHGYYIAVSPVDGNVYISDPEKYHIIRVLMLDNVTDPQNNIEVVIGNGERCIPGDEKHCGDKGPAKKARLSHPKGMVISPEQVMYIADGTNIRTVDSRGIIHTLIGHHSHKTRWKPLPCKGGIPASQVELQWPTVLALSTLDNTLHILDDHVILQVTNDGTVRVKVGVPLHCQSKDKITKIGTITSMAFDPSGAVYIAEESAEKRYTIRRLDSSGKLTHVAGALPEDCGCIAGEKCTCPSEEVVLSTSIVFGPITSITATPDGILHVADQQALKVFRLVHYLPSDDQNGDFQVAYPKANEIYLFNRHGHHVETRDLVTGRTKYSFLYSKNTSFGKLSKITDSSGNKVVFLRDYTSAVSQIENTMGEKFPLQISRLGLLARFSERAGRHYDFTYEDETGLLSSATSPGGLTTIYEYDSSGRVTTVISPTGSRTVVDSWLGSHGPDKRLTVVVGEDRALQLTTSSDGEAFFKHGEVESRLQVQPNGTWIQEFPWGGTAQSFVMSSPLLEVALPTQARLLHMVSSYRESSAEAGPVNVLAISYGVIGDPKRRGHLVETLLLVNGSRILTRRWDGSTGIETLSDSDRRALLKVTYNPSGQVQQLGLNSDESSVTISYNKYGRISQKKWGKQSESYKYDTSGILSSITTSTSLVTRFTFGSQSKLPETISLPSGRTWVFKYDDRGGLKHVITPQGSMHFFSVQPSFGSFIFSYIPPGSGHPFRQHLDHNGRLLISEFPPTATKILYSYTDNGQLSEIVHGDGKTQLFYGKDGFVSEIFYEDGDLEYKVDYLYTGKLLSELIINYGAKTGLSNVKFTYECDSNFRVSSFSGRIGGQNLHHFPFGYSTVNGELVTAGPFQIVRTNASETLIQDGTAQFSRKINSLFQVTETSLMIHGMLVFRLEMLYNNEGKIASTSTYTRNFHAKLYTNTKNYTYDSDGQIVAVDATEPWSFKYDANGNMLSLTYSTRTIPMKYDTQDRIVGFGEGKYRYDAKGSIIQNAREATYQYNARGLLIRAVKSGRFNIRYYYDHESRLIARKDNYGNVTQYFYTDTQLPNLITHIYSPRDGNVITLVYNDRGHVVYAQVYRNKYYIATDECGTPIMIFNQYGEVVREMMRSPFGRIMYDSNPYLYLPLDYCGGIIETPTELVHMPMGRVYDPLIDHKKWLESLGYNLDSLAPQFQSSLYYYKERKDLWTSFTRSPYTPLEELTSPFQEQVAVVPCISGLAQNVAETRRTSSHLSTFSPSKLKRNFWPENYKFEISALPGPFGEGILVSSSGGKAIITSTSYANPIFRDVLTSVFNSSHLIDIVLNSHNLYVFYFVKENYWKASEDMTQLNRLAGEVNITIHEPNSTPGSPDDDKYIDVKLHSSSSIVHIRYGTTPQQETKRLLKHAKKVTIRRAWSEERDRVTSGLPTLVDWTPGETEELRSKGSVINYSARYLHPPELYPQLVDDPSNIKFVRDTKRTRRNSKSKRSKSHHCYKWWWKGLC